MHQKGKHPPKTNIGTWMKCQPWPLHPCHRCRLKIRGCTCILGILCLVPGVKVPHFQSVCLGGRRIRRGNAGGPLLTTNGITGARGEASHAPPPLHHPKEANRMGARHRAKGSMSGLDWTEGTPKRTKSPGRGGYEPSGGPLTSVDLRGRKIPKPPLRDWSVPESDGDTGR